MGARRLLVAVELILDTANVLLCYVAWLYSCSQSVQQVHTENKSEKNGWSGLEHVLGISTSFMPDSFVIWKEIFPTNDVKSCQDGGKF